jgi:hypothetical protein
LSCCRKAPKAGPSSEPTRSGYQRWSWRDDKRRLGRRPHLGRFSMQEHLGRRIKSSMKKAATMAATSLTINQGFGLSTAAPHVGGIQGCITLVARSRSVSSSYPAYFHKNANTSLLSRFTPRVHRERAWWIQHKRLVFPEHLRD